MFHIFVETMKRSFIVLILALIPLMLLSCGKRNDRPSRERAHEYYEEGVRQHANGNYLEAILSLMEAEKYAQASSDASFKVMLYQELAASCTAAGTFEDGIRYADSAETYASIIGDTLIARNARLKKEQAQEFLYSSRMNRQPILRAQRKLLEEQNARLTQQESRQRRTFLTVIAALLVLLAAILLFFRHRNRLLIQEKESLIEACKALTAYTPAPQDAQESLRNRYAELCRKHQLDQIANTLFLSLEADSRLFKDIKKAIKDIRLDSESQQAFEKMIDASLDNTMRLFRETFPGRKPSFYQFASYLFIGFDAATISTLLYDMAKDRIYVKKYQLKQLIAKTDSPYQQQFLQLIR